MIKINEVSKPENICGLCGCVGTIKHTISYSGANRTIGINLCDECFKGLKKGLSDENSMHQRKSGKRKDNNGKNSQDNTSGEGLQIADN